MKLNIIGQIFGTSGYANHTRGLANALMKEHDVKISTQLPNQWERETNDQELKAILKQDSKDRTNIIIDLPHNWPIHLNKEKNICFCVWEGDKIPLSYIDNILDERVSQVWVPSIHTQEAIRKTFEESDKTYPKDKIKIVPHGVDIEIYQPQALKGGKPEFTFLMNKGFRNELDRGGVQHGIKAFLNEFKKGEAKLIIKLNPAYAMPPDQLTNLINKYVAELKLDIKEIPEIVAIYENLTPKKLNELYNECDVFLNPTGGEAFSLPCIEAMACSKPVITTNFGGQIDYVTNATGWLIDYELQEVKHEVMYEGVSWAVPNMEQLKRVMREAVNDPEMVSALGSQGLEVAQDYTWFNSASKASQYL